MNEWNSGIKQFVQSPHSGPTPLIRDWIFPEANMKEGNGMGPKLVMRGKGPRRKGEKGVRGFGRLSNGKIDFQFRTQGM